jgi:hypothetical protein
MLRTNLSTRPFYNARAVRAIVIGVGAIVVVATIANLVELVRLTTEQRRLSADAVQAETQARQLTREAAQIRGRIDPAELATVSAAATEANAIIDRRAFSWTELFSRFEAALPEDVRITAVQPRRETNGSFAVSVAVQARRVEGVDGFIEALESQGTFKNVLPAEEQTDEDGLIEAVLDGQYLPEAQPSVAAEPAPTPQSGPSPPRASAGATSSHD